MKHHRRMLAGHTMSVLLATDSVVLERDSRLPSPRPLHTMLDAVDMRRLLLLLLLLLLCWHFTIKPNNLVCPPVA